MDVITQMFIFLNGKKYSTESNRVHTWTIIVLIYINDLSKSVSDKSSPILFADDTSFIIVNRNDSEINFNIKEIFNEINKWFRILY